MLIKHTTQSDTVPAVLGICISFIFGKFLIFNN